VHSILFISASQNRRNLLKSGLKNRFDLSISSTLTLGARYARKLFADLIIIDYSIRPSGGSLREIMKQFISPKESHYIIFLVEKDEYPEFIAEKGDLNIGFYISHSSNDDLIFMENFVNYLEETVKRMNQERTVLFYSQSMVHSSSAEQKPQALFFQGISEEIMNFNLQFSDGLHSREPMLLLASHPWDIQYLTRSMNAHFHIHHPSDGVFNIRLNEHDLKMQKTILNEILYPSHDRNKRGIYIITGMEHFHWNLQEKLLKALKEPDIFQHSRFKIILTATTSLKKHVDKGKLRQDLYYRLKNFSVVFPLLQSRAGDINLILEHFFQWYQDKTNRKIKLDMSIRTLLLEYAHKYSYEVFHDYLFILLSLASHSGVSLEDFYHIKSSEFLKNPLVEKCIIQLKNKTMAPDSEKNQEKTSLFTLEKNYIREVLRQNQNNISQTARILGISRKTLYDRLKKYQIDSDSSREA